MLDDENIKKKNSRLLFLIFILIIFIYIIYYNINKNYILIIQGDPKETQPKNC